MDKVVILGSGSWGTGLAVSLANNKKPVTLWCRNPEQAAEMTAARENSKYLPKVHLAESIQIVTDMEEAVREADIVIMSVPSQSVRETAVKIKPLLRNDAIIVNTAKGLEANTHLRLSQVIEEIIPDAHERLVVLYGPSHAEEVGQNLPTLIVASAYNAQAASKVQDLFMSPTFRVYTNDDVIGVEIGGALKNIIALATGIAFGMGFGDNAQAGLLTRGMMEISRLGLKLGAQYVTFAGLTGIGDLVVTCTSMHSRNRRAGIALGQGKHLSDVLKDMGMVVEGVTTTKAAVELARSLDVSMPIAEQMYAVLFEDADVHQAVANLMGRSKKSEKEDFLY